MLLCLLTYCACARFQSDEEVSRTDPGGVLMAGGEGTTTGASASVGRVDTTAGGPSAPQRPSSPPPSLDMFCPIAENWCYTQASHPLIYVIPSTAHWRIHVWADRPPPWIKHGGFLLFKY